MWRILSLRDYWKGNLRDKVGRSTLVTFLVDDNSQYEYGQEQTADYYNHYNRDCYCSIYNISYTTCREEWKEYILVYSEKKTNSGIIIFWRNVFYVGGHTKWKHKSFYKYVIPVCWSSVTVITDEFAPYPILVLARTYKWSSNTFTAKCNYYVKYTDSWKNCNSTFLAMSVTAFKSNIQDHTIKSSQIKRAHAGIEPPKAT